MTALVGQFAAITGPAGPDGLWYRARTVDIEAQPSWLLGQMWSMWRYKFRKDTGRLCATLLQYDWSVLAHTAWPAQLVDEPASWTYVTGVGRAHRRAPQTPPLVRQMPGTAPRPGQQWAYLWENQGGALHVYAAADERWHHLATLPAPVFTGLTAQLIADIEDRRGWLERAA